MSNGLDKVVADQDSFYTQLHFILRMKEKVHICKGRKKLKEIMPAEALSSLYGTSVGLGGMR